MATVPALHEPQGKRVRGYGGALPPAGAGYGWVRDWDAIPNPLGGETFPVVLKMLRWLNSATSGYLRNRSFDDVFLRQDSGNREG